MKQFFQDHSYDMVKMFLNQFATAIFGFVLTLASLMAKSAALRNFTSIFAILFYLFLLYTMTWEIGYRDKISVEMGKKKKIPMKGALIALCANGINFLLAIVVALSQIPALSSFLEKAGALCVSIALFLEGMFTGLLTNKIGGFAVSSYWFVYFLLPIPAILVCGLAYHLGIHDIKFTSIFDPVYPESDRDPNEKKKRSNR